MAEFTLHEGEEIIVLRRKTNIIEEGGEKKELHQDETISRVRVPYEITIIGGMIDVNWETTKVGDGPGDTNYRDQRFFIIKYLTR